MIESIHNFLETHWQLLAAGCIGWIFSTLIWAWRNNVNVRRAYDSGFEQNAEQQHATQQLLESQVEASSRDYIRVDSEAKMLDQQLQKALNEVHTRTEQVMKLESGQAAVGARLEEAKRSFAEKELVFKNSSASLKIEFEALANKVFERQGTSQSERLTQVLNPFKEQMSEFRKRVEHVYHTDTKDRASLLAEVRNLQSASERINTEAENLTKALKGDKKIQGNWGELVLERVLEESGLRLGHEYLTQQSKRNDIGELKRPDVLIRLPEDKDVVVDAKVSLIAYEQAVSAEDDETRTLAIREHINALKNHVRRLSEQDYDKLEDVRSLDFVLLFIPIESAFTLAMEHDVKLFNEAFERRIVIVSPTTLMMTLRIIHNVWRYEKQNQNSQEIARRAGNLYDKLAGLVEDMDKIGRQLATVEKTHNTAFAKLTTGKGNLVRQVEQFRELGAPVKKQLPQNLIDEAEAADLHADFENASSQENGEELDL